MPVRAKKRTRKPQSQDVVSVYMPPTMVAEVELWAKRAGVNRSELGRFVFSDGLARIKRRGRNWLKNQLQEGRGEQTAPGEADADEDYWPADPRDPAAPGVC